MKRHFSLRTFTPELNSRNIVIFSALIVALIFLTQGNVGFNLEDEGFLWYGTIRTALGDVPIRDFQSYDPGRYYWGALWFKLLRSDGIIALRISQAVFQFIGVTIALLLVRRVTRKWLPLIGTALLMLVWMFPPWKIYEPVITIAAVFFAVRLIENTSWIRHLWAGAFVGLAAFFGRNHGVYCLVAFLLLTFFVWWKIDRKDLLLRLVALSLGVVIGYLPMLLMLALIPGFFHSFLDAVLFNVRVATNLPLPVPWPWRVHYSFLALKTSIHGFAVGILYLAFPAFFIFAFAALFLKPGFRANRLFTASVFVGAIYLHYIFERPHLYYLAWTIPPLILGLIALPYSFSGPARRKIAFIVWSCLAVFSFTAAEMAPENYFLIKVRGAVRERVLNRFHVDVAIDMPEQHHALVKSDVRGNTLWVTNDIAETIQVIETVGQQIPPNEGFLVAPYWTAFYPILRKQSPTWEIYFLFPQPKDKQEIIERDLERAQVKWAFVCDYYLDNQPELRFSSTHSYVWQYLDTNFEPVPIAQPTDALHYCELLHKKASASALPKSTPAADGNSTATPLP